MAAALTRRTTQARIMVLGNAIGIRGNPLRVAEEIAMLDLLSGGRVDSGFVRGIGWEYFGHSVNPVKSRSRFNEAHDLIIKAWTSPEMFSWYGENYEYRYVNLWPRPLQQPHPTPRENASLVVLAAYRSPSQSNSTQPNVTERSSRRARSRRSSATSSASRL